MPSIASNGHCEAAQSPPDSELLDRYTRLNCGQSFRELHDRHNDALCRFLVRSYRLEPNDTDDISQQTWLAVATDCNRFEGRCTFETWLFSIAKNRAIAAGRQRKRLRDRFGEKLTADVRDQCQAVDSDLVATEERHSLAVAVDRLRPPQRRAICTVYYGETQLSEAASTLGIAVSSLKSRLQRARESLRESLTDHAA